MKNTVFPFFGLLSLWAALLITPATAAELTIACGAVGIERQVCIDGANRWAEQTGHRVDVVATPQSSTERLAMYQLLLRERHNTVDVFQIDVIWPGLLGDYLLDLSPYVSDTEAFFPNLMANNTVDSRLIAMPWYVDTGLLYWPYAWRLANDPESAASLTAPPDCTGWLKVIICSATLAFGTG